MPTVLTTAITINHAKCLFLADFHKAKSFQTNDQIKIIAINQTAIPTSPAIVSKYSIFTSVNFNVKKFKKLVTFHRWF